MELKPCKCGKYEIMNMVGDEIFIVCNTCKLAASGKTRKAVAKVWNKLIKEETTKSDSTHMAK